MSLQTDYDSFNNYRGDIEQRRKSAEDKFLTERNNTRKELIESGLKPGSRNYNKGMEVTHASYQKDIVDINRDMDTFNKSTQVANLQDFYEKSNQFDETKKEYLSQDEFERVKPSFNEFVTSEFGTQQQQEQGMLTQQRKISNVRGIR